MIYSTILVLCYAIIAAHASVEVRWFTTSRNLDYKLSERDPVQFSPIDSVTSNATGKTIFFDENKRFQTIFGIGSSLESSTCYNLMRMTEADRSDTLKKLLDPVDGIGMSLMRITVATSDFCPLPFYSYDDAASPDEDLSGFSIEKDEEFILPVLRDVARTYTAGPDGLRFFASTWSPPAWMKTSNTLQGGRYNTAYFPQYALYLLKFINAYKDEGIEITGLTPQNEPLQNEDTYPTTLLLPEEEAEFIRDHLGPLLHDPSSNCSTAIWCFDHNFNTLFYPETVLKDSQANKYVSGTAFHNYGGKATAMSELHDEYPDKNIFFSEGSAFGVRGAAQIVEILRNWATTYNAWVTILDSDLEPNAGPFKPSPTMIELDSVTLKPTFRFEYYMYGQFSKFIRRGAVRIETTSASEPAASKGDRDESDQIAHVGFVDSLNNGNQKRTLVLVNEAQEDVLVAVQWLGMEVTASLPPASVNTFVWEDE